MHVVKKLIIITDPIIVRDAVLSGKNSQKLSWKNVKRKLLKSTGLTDDIAIPFSVGNEGKVLDVHIKNSVCLSRIVNKIQHIMHTDKHMLPLLDNHNDGDDGSWVSFEMLHFFGRGILYFSMNALFNLPSLANDEFYQHFLKYNSRIQYFLLLGAFISKKLFKEEYASRETLIQMIKDIIVNEADSSSKNQVLSEIFNTIDGLDINISDATYLDSQARLLYLMFIASFFNTVPSTFWIIYHLLYNNNAYKAIQEEVDTIYKERVKIYNEEKKGQKEDNEIIFFELSDLQKMHKIDSLIKEVFRLKTTKQVMVNRVATDDLLMKVPINNEMKTIFIKKGTTFITSPTLAHTDEEVFKNAQEFKWDRFLPYAREDGTTAVPKFYKNGVELRNPVNPFGGGKTLCPGRLLAVAEMKIMVAWMLLKYDLRFKDGIVPKEEPRLKSPKNTPSNGYPKDDISIEARKRVVG